MRTFASRDKLKVDEENPYWITFSDLMSALLIIFILAAVALIIELTQTQRIIENDIQQLQNAVQARRDILHEIKEELKKHNIIVNISDNESILRIPEETLSFASNSDRIPWEKRDAIKLIGMIIHKAINKPFANDQSILRSNYLDTVFIEGHTDSWRTKNYKGGNWGLSSNRAISLWEFWNDKANVIVSPTFDEMTNATGQKLFSVSGYASSRRIETVEDTNEQRSANRRIDIRFTVIRPKVADLENIIKK